MHLCNEMNKIHILLKLNGTQRWQEKFFNIKSIHINEEISHKKIISCTKIKELKNFGNISLQIKMQVGKPRRNNSARCRKVEGGSIVNRNTLCIE